MAYRLLLVDSDEVHRASLGERLQDDGFAVATAVSVRTALAAANRGWPHLAMVDVRFADGTAEDLARRLLRRGEVPFVVVSTAVDGPTKVRALESFADDYVERPYLYAELLARIHRVLRRASLRAGDVDGVIELGGGWSVVSSCRELRRRDRVVSLTPTETRLLEFFWLNAERVLPTPLILQRVWFEAPAGENTLWEYVRRLRRKLGDDGGTHLPRIRNVRGIGYRYCRGEITSEGARGERTRDADGNLTSVDETR
jgi:DNA-binding response OmpR family regulator